MALELWTRRPYSVLLARGNGVNAVEVPATHGQRALAQLALSERGPVAATPFGAWLPVPPTARDGLPYRWQVPPSGVGWVLPASADVQRVLVASLRRPASGARPSLA
ncbi:MAG: hypothetical protein ACRDSL_12680 [Pseudonocardiaceae bacterium]